MALPEHDFEPPKVRARHADPETSKEAAAAFDASGKVQPSVAAVVALLKSAGIPLHDFEIAARWSSFWGREFSESLPRKARHWAKEAGFVIHVGHAEHQGRRVRLWALTEKGRSA
jgi:hypothetical protein